MADSNPSDPPQPAPGTPPAVSSPRSPASATHPLFQSLDGGSEGRRGSLVEGLTPSSASGRPFSALERAFGRRMSEVSLTPLGDTARAIQAGEIGAAYGPYPRHQSLSTSSSAPLFSRRGSHMSSDVAIDLLSRTSPTTSTPDVGKSDSHLELPRLPYALRSSAASSYGSLPVLGGDSVEVYDTHNPPSTDDLDVLRSSPSSSKPFLPAVDSNSRAIRRSQLGLASQSTPCPSEDIRFFLWEKGNEDIDDYLHEPDEEVDKILDRQARKTATWRAAADVSSLIIVVLVVLGLFLGWPVLRFGIIGSWQTAHHGGGNSLTGPSFGPGGINASGQVPKIPGDPGLIDVDTPLEAYSLTSAIDGDEYKLFNRDGRTFWPGDDPYWEAVDIRYWQTQDYEWYDPDAIITKDGSLQITLTQEPTNNLNFRSGMLQSWNKFCFTGGRIEVNCSFPGNSRAMGYWPGAWTMGNLGRPGYGGSNHGVWPYSYDSCDVGTLPNQTWQDRDGPEAARTSGLRDYGGQLSYLPGQRLSACTCDGEDHPGPRNNVGRGAPEIDITEQQVDWRGTGSTSQSMQFAPMGAGYGWNTSSDWTIFNESITVQNLFTGAVNQASCAFSLLFASESASVITLTDTTSYDGQGYTTFAFEYEPGADGRVTWFVNNTPSWQLNGGAVGPDAETEVAQRLISVEPMSITINLAISPAFQPPDWANIRFPGTFRVDYVRVYQKGEPNVGCDPKDYPTSAYIQRNLDLYMNPNLTTFPRPFPKNSASAAGCA